VTEVNEDGHAEDDQDSDELIDDEADSMSKMSSEYDLERSKLDASKAEVLSQIEGEKNRIQVGVSEGSLQTVKASINAHQVGHEADLGRLNQSKDKAVRDLNTAQGYLGMMQLRAPIDGGGPQYLTAWRNLSRSSPLVAVSIARWDALASWRTELGIVAGVAIGMAIMLAIAGFWITASSRAHAHAIAERDQADAALRTSQAQFQSIMDHTPVFVFVKDLEGRYTFINRAAERWTTERSKPELGMTSHDFLSERAAKDVSTADRKVIATKSPV